MKEGRSMKRINKFMAEAGICSRREADQLIQTKSVTINGEVATLGSMVGPTDLVKVNRKEVGHIEEKMIFAFYKPRGVTCTAKDKFAKKTVMEYMKTPVRVTYAGRLDQDSEGLLLMTNDGDLIQALMKGANGHEKEYIVKVKQKITDVFLQKMSQGIYIKDLKQSTKPCKIEKIGDYTFNIILTQGLNRQIRRMCQELSYEVVSLKRIRVNTVSLGNQKIGTLRKLDKKECKQLYQSVRMNPPKEF